MVTNNPNEERYLAAARFYSRVITEVGPEIRDYLGNITKGCQFLFRNTETDRIKEVFRISAVGESYPDLLCCCLELLRRNENEFVLSNLLYLKINEERYLGSEFRILKLLLIVCAMSPDAYARFNAILEKANETPIS